MPDGSLVGVMTEMQWLVGMVVLGVETVLKFLREVPGPEEARCLR